MREFCIDTTSTPDAPIPTPTGVGAAVAEREKFLKINSGYRKDPGLRKIICFLKAITAALVSEPKYDVTNPGAKYPF